MMYNAPHIIKDHIEVFYSIPQYKITSFLHYPQIFRNRIRDSSVIHSITVYKITQFFINSKLPRKQQQHRSIA